MAQVIPLRKRKREAWREGDGVRAMPFPFHPQELERLLRLAAGDSRSLEEIRYASRTVRGWWLSRQQKRGDWVMVVLNAMRSGWALKGFKRYQSSTPAEHEINARTGEAVGKRTLITADLLAELVLKHAEKVGLEPPEGLNLPQGELYDE